MESGRAKVYASLAILLTGSLLVAIAGTGSEATMYQAQGTIIDFGEYDVVWTTLDLHANDNAITVLDEACDSNGFTYTLDSDGRIIEMAGLTSGASGSWRLYVIDSGSTEWRELSAPYDRYGLMDYTVSSWAYRADGEKPTVAVDMNGRCIYGYQQSYRTISLTPTITEIMGAIGAVYTLVGTDAYSDWPTSVLEYRESGRIAVVGDYTTPSFENILKQNPDAVFCDGELYNHIQVSKKLTNAGKLAILLYGGSDVKSILDNIFIVGRVIGYYMASEVVINDLTNVMDQMDTLLDSSSSTRDVNVMVALSPDVAPYVSGSYTFIADVLSMVHGVNVFSSSTGWLHTNGETILANNPSVIIIMTSGYESSDYDAMIAGLSNEWKGTDAYRSGEIYLVSGDAGDMMQRSGPRIAQTMELVGRIINPDSFGDGIVVEKYVGDEYEDYLSPLYTKYMGYDG